MQRAVSRPAKFRFIGIYSLIAVTVTLGIAFIFISRAPVAPLPTPTSAPNAYRDVTNIAQGDAGDCYFLAALLTVAATSPETVLNMARDNADGGYTVSASSYLTMPTHCSAGDFLQPSRSGGRSGGRQIDAEV